MRMKSRGVAALLSMALVVNMVSLTAAAEEIDGNLTIVSENADTDSDLENAGGGPEDAGDDLENPGDGLENPDDGLENPDDDLENPGDDLKDEGESGNQEDAGEALESEEPEKTGGITHSITMKSIEEPQPQAEEQPDESMARDIRNEKVEVTGYDAQKGTFRVVVSNVADAEQAKKVVLPVWSAVNGQDDIVWYDAKADGNGSYYADVNLRNHKGFGVYNVHAYAELADRSLRYVGAAKLDIDSPGIGRVEVRDYNSDKGTFQVVLSGITNPNLIHKIAVPIWSAVNGQDDIIWYDARRDNSGNYYVDVDVKNHKYSAGVYDIHVYCTDITGLQFFAGKTQHNVETQQGELTVAKSSDNEYVAELRNAKIPGGVAGVQFPVWSAVNGQDDIIWYNAVRGNDGIYRCKISLKDHKGFGDYTVHAYVKSSNGSLVFAGASGFKVEAPSIGKVEASVTDKANGQFRVRISDIKNADLIKEIKVPVWSEKNQGDIVWYKAARAKDGSYILDVNVSNHKYNSGIYNIHVYVSDMAGGDWFAGATNCKMDIEFGSLEAKDIDGTESTYRITLSGMRVPAGASKIQFAVWGSQGGQNDIKWYTAARQSNGSYVYDVKIANHKEAGDYNVHAYCVTRSNTLQFAGNTGFTVVKKPMIASVNASDINGAAGTFKVTVSGVVASFGVQEVRVPVWCAADQSDIVWYKAIRAGSSNTYAVNVNIADHGYHFGSYKIHVYITMGNGVQLYAGAAKADIKASNYVYSVPISSSRREVGIIGVNAERVQFPTWSTANGQDDIVWYDGVNQGNGKWSVVVNSANHKSDGAYVTHVYVTSGGKKKNAGSLSYSLTSAAEERLQRDVTAVYNQVGRDLYACYNWVANTITYQRINGHVTPPAGYTREQWYAVMGLESHQGNCYCYAAAFAYLARHLGYNAEYVEGSVPKRSGGYTPHGWVVINGAYICDPEAQAEIGGANFYMQPINSPVMNYVR